MNRYYQRFKTIDERFWEKVAVGSNEDCWPWLAALTHDNYGRFSVDGGQVMSHRMAWILTNGKLEPNICVCHSCDNPPCCNPAHLWLGRHQDNQRDMAHKKRRSGTINGRSILKETDIPRIISLRENGLTYTDIAKKYAVSKHTIGRIIRGEGWTHI